MLQTPRCTGTGRQCHARCWGALSAASLPATSCPAYSPCLLMLAVWRGRYYPSSRLCREMLQVLCLKILCLQVPCLQILCPQVCALPSGANAECMSKESKGKQLEEHRRNQKASLRRRGMGVLGEPLTLEQTADTSGQPPNIGQCVIGQ